MYESTLWQQWGPLDEEPYKQPDYKQYVKQCLLREELQYDTYVGENYKAEEYGINHWKHDPDVADLLQTAQRAKCCERREPVTNADPAVFGINRFRNNQVALFQRTHHNSVQHLPYIHGSDQPRRTVPC